MIDLLNALKLDAESFEFAVLFEIKSLRNVVIDEFEIRILKQVLDVSHMRRGKIVHADHVIVPNKSVA